MSCADPSPQWKLSAAAMALTACLCAFNCAIFFSMNQGLLDFTSMYTAGGLVVEGHCSLLFDFTTQAEFQNRVLGLKGVLPFNHLAFESLLFAPLAMLPFSAALWIWRLISAGMLVLSTRQLADAFNIVRSHAFWLAVAFTPVVVAIAQGQDSLLFLLLLSSAMTCMNRDRDRSAGSLLAMALFKPHLILPIALLLAWRRGYRFLQGFLGGATAVLLVSTCITGVNGWTQMGTLWRSDASSAALQFGADVNSMPNLRGMLSVMGFGAHSAWLLSAALSLLLFALVAWLLRGQRSAKILFPPLIAIAVLICGYVNAHDLALLLIPVLYLLTSNRKSMNAAAGAAYCLLLFVIAGHIAFFFFVICWILYLTAQAAAAEPPPPIAA